MSMVLRAVLGILLGRKAMGLRKQQGGNEAGFETTR
jgi:hypothetical protein